MNISHRELDYVARNPSQWLRERSSPGIGFPQLGYDAVVRFGIFRYHRDNDGEAAADHVEAMLDRNSHRLKNASRIEDAKERLADYVNWAEGSELVVIETGALLDYPSGNGLQLRGRVSRIDLLDDGFRAVILGDVGPDWDASIRMPLLQEAIAAKYAVPVQDTYVGVQNLDGSNLRFRRFAPEDRGAAVVRFQQLASDLGL